MFSVRNLVCATAFALTTAVATHASAATEVYIDSIGQYNNASVQIFGPGINVNAQSDALKIVANLGVGPGDPTFTVWGFCIDLFHDIDAGYFSQLPVDKQYHVDALTNDGNGHSLSATQVNEIYGLANLGFNLIQANAADLQNKLSGIQGAIWAIEYPTFTFTGGTVALNNYITSYVGQAAAFSDGKAGAGAYALLSDNGQSQGFVIGVPEPATWMMMIMGFGAIGVMLRSSRRRLVTAA
jgi:hypothetical protein